MASLAPDQFCLIVTDALCLAVVSPVAGGDDRVIDSFIVPSRHAACGSVRAADSPIGMVAGSQGTIKVVSRYAAHIDGAASATAHAAPGIAGNESATVVVVSHHAAGIIGACTPTFKGHVARGIAGGQGGF